MGLKNLINKMVSNLSLSEERGYAKKIRENFFSER